MKYEGLCDKCGDYIIVVECDKKECNCMGTWMESQDCSCGKYSNPSPPIPVPIHRRTYYH